MDFPNDVSTNVHKIDDVKEIYWANFTGRHGEEEQEKKVHNEQPVVEGQHVERSLQVFEYSLRERGYHVLLDEVQPGLWVFCLSEAEKERLVSSQLVNGFECVTSGCSRSTDLSLASGPVTKATNTATTSSRPIANIGEINQQTFNANMKTDTWPPAAGSDDPMKSVASVGFAIANIYPKFLAALSRTISNDLSKTKRLLMVGSCVCVDMHTMGDHAYDCLEFGLAAAETVLVSCSIRWLSSGTLVFGLCGKTVPQLSTLPFVLPDSADFGRLPLGSPLLLSPSGVAGRYCGIESTPKSDIRYRQRAEIKSSILSEFTLRGMSMPAKTQWILVQMNAHQILRQTGEETVERSPYVTLWPAHLCLCKDPTTITKHDEPMTLPNLESDNDPLERARQWFLGKRERREAVEQRRIKDLAETQKIKETADTEDEDLISDFDRQIDQDITPRDVSGIYPTPPDGLPFIAPESSTSYEPPPDGVVEEGTEELPSDKTHPPYDEQRNNDLFEEMDIDVFATNGLTEDDFNFFDEPGFGGEDMHNDTDATFARESITHEEPVNSPMTMLPVHGHPSSTSENPLDDAQTVPPLHLDPKVEEPGTLISLLPSSTSIADGRLEGYSSQKIKKENPAADCVLTSTDDQETLDPTRVKEEAATRSSFHFESLLPEPSQHQKPSFELVTFNRTSSNFDNKYGSHGRYAFSVLDPPKSSDPIDSIFNEKHVPHFGVLNSRQSSHEDGTDVDDTDEEVSVGSMDDPENCDEHVGGYAEEEVQTQNSHDLHPQTIRKRKRRSSETPDHLATPLSSTSLMQGQAQSMEETATLFAPADLFSPSPTRHVNHDLIMKFDDDFPSGTVIVGKDQSFIQVAQLVAHQAISGNQIMSGTTDHWSEQNGIDMRRVRYQFEGTITSLFSHSGKASKRCTLKDFINLDDQESINLSRSHNTTQPKPPKLLYPNRASLTLGQTVFKFPGPYTCVQRAGAQIDIAASALRFWEELSLAPSHGSKNVTSFCIFPAESVKEYAVTFLDMVRGAYQSCNLGLHDLGYGDHAGGLFPVHMGEGRLWDRPEAIYSACEDLGVLLGKLKLRGGNTVIYMVNPSQDERFLPILCSAFLKLFDAYITIAKERNLDKPNDLVFQCVPFDLVYSTTGIPMPSLSDYRKLAFEVYDRCGPNDNWQANKTSQYVCAPTIRLAKAVPKTIDFRLTSDNSALSLQSDNCLHIAYAWSPEDEWFTASWTDNLGLLSWSACYCLGGTNDDPWPVVSKIANEIWETTLDMLQPRSGSWHLFISKADAVQRKELEVWHSVFGDANKSSVKSSFRWSFLTMDLDPLLEFPIESLEIKGSDVTMNSLVTPDNTPQANAPSPEISGLGLTPGGATQVSTPPPSTAFGDHDPEARLVDVADETWGVVTNLSADDMGIASDYCPALSCGYLVKRAGPRDEDGLVRVGVNVVHGLTPPRPLLKAVLGMYRNLGLLARVRGIADPVKSVVPYHVAATLRAHAAVTSTMRYGGRDSNG